MNQSRATFFLTTIRNAAAFALAVASHLRLLSLPYSSRSEFPLMLCCSPSFSFELWSSRRTGTLPSPPVCAAVATFDDGDASPLSPRFIQQAKRAHSEHLIV
jgi:hypothetical protein